MAGYCRFCHEDKNRQDEDAYVACSNCGSFACDDHFEWVRHSRDALCIDCLPPQAASGAATGAQLAAALTRPKNEAFRALAQRLSADGELRALLSSHIETSRSPDGIDRSLLERLSNLLWYLSVAFSSQRRSDE